MADKSGAVLDWDKLDPVDDSAPEWDKLSPVEDAPSAELFADTPAPKPSFTPEGYKPQGFLEKTGRNVVAAIPRLAEGVVALGAELPAYLGTQAEQAIKDLRGDTSPTPTPVYDAARKAREWLGEKAAAVSGPTHALQIDDELPWREKIGQTWEAIKNDPAGAANFMYEQGLQNALPMGASMKMASTSLKASKLAGVSAGRAMGKAAVKGAIPMFPLEYAGAAQEMERVTGQPQPLYALGYAAVSSLIEQGWEVPTLARQILTGVVKDAAKTTAVKGAGKEFAKSFLSGIVGEPTEEALQQVSQNFLTAMSDPKAYPFTPDNMLRGVGESALGALGMGGVAGGVTGARGALELRQGKPPAVHQGNDLSLNEQASKDFTPKTDIPPVSSQEDQDLLDLAAATMDGLEGRDVSEWTEADKGLHEVLSSLPEGDAAAVRSALPGYVEIVRAARAKEAGQPTEAPPPAPKPAIPVDKPVDLTGKTQPAAMTRTGAPAVEPVSGPAPIAAPAVQTSESGDFLERKRDLINSAVEAGKKAYEEEKARGRAAQSAPPAVQAVPIPTDRQVDLLRPEALAPPPAPAPPAAPAVPALPPEQALPLRQPITQPLPAPAPAEPALAIAPAPVAAPVSQSAIQNLADGSPGAKINKITISTGKNMLLEGDVESLEEHIVEGGKPAEAVVAGLRRAIERAGADEAAKIGAHKDLAYVERRLAERGLLPAGRQEKRAEIVSEGEAVQQEPRPEKGAVSTTPLNIRSDSAVQFDISSIPEDAKIDIKVYRKKTGKAATIKANAREAYTETISDIGKISKALEDCL
jgi:hypothetical protein